MTRGSAVRIFAAVLGLLALGVGGAAGRTLDTGTTTIQVQVIGGGQVTSDGGQITCGAGSQQCYYTTTATTGTVNLTAVEQGSWTFDSWSGSACTTSGDDFEICTISLTAAGGDFEVIANFSSDGSGTKMLTVTRPEGGDLNGGDIDCGSEDVESDCTWIVTEDSTITLLEEPDSGYTFGSWGGACGGSGPSCSVTMSDDQAVSGTFTKSATTFALTVSVTGNGTVAGPSIACTSAGGSSCSADQAAGTTVTLTAQPGSGASFNGWAGACAGTSPSCSVTMSSAKSVQASFSGASPNPPASDFPLGVSVTGDGTVTGGGISCGSGATNCTVNQTAGTTVTLTATPDTGATFTSWGGACSGAATTCTVTMTAAKSVTATFTTSGTGVTLSVTVTGPGSVSGGGIQCGNGGTTCTARPDEDSTVTLTATPAANATFTGWDGACSGNDATCTVTMDASKSVSAAFKSEGRTPVGVRTLSSRGRPVVRRTKNGWLVTLRFATAQAGRARVRATRAGRLQTALAFPVARGAATVGPFTVTRPGFYVFDLSLGVRRLRWTACLGRCGAAAHAGPFVLVRGPAKAVDAGALWSLAVRFRSTMPAAARLRIFRSGRLARDVRFAPPAGAFTAGPFLLSPGTYQLRLAATDAYGRVRRLSWYAFLP
jgi:Divergent InlB B-repeat domain